MKRSTKLLVIVATAVSTVAFAGASWAYWTTTGTGTASGKAGTLAAPVIATPVTATGSAVSLNWSAVTAPGAGTVRYYVLRDNAAASAECGTSASPITATSCSDTGVPNGLHSYTVTAKFQSWTATSAAASVTVNGDTTPPTVTINQAAGQADPTNSGTVNFTVVFSESVTGFTGSDVAIGGTGTGGTKAATVTGGPTTYNVAVSGATGNGTITATVPASAAQDAAGNNNSASTSTDNTVTLDTTAPTGSSLSTSNGGVAAGLPEPGDSVSLTFSEQINTATILAGWIGSATNIVVRGNDGGTGTDTLTFFNSANNTQLPLGSLDLGSKKYFTGNVTFGASGTASSMSAVTTGGKTVITITFGTASGTTTGSDNQSILTWTPSSTVTDLAGNALNLAITPVTGNIKQF
jgi:hypothetical protein